MIRPAECPLLKGPIAWMAANPVAANLFMLILLIGGLSVGSGIRQEVFPAFDREQVRVSIAYPGAGPEEVERGIILAVEAAIQNLDGVDDLLSTASEGRAVIIVDALEGADTRRLSKEIESEIDAITSFPGEAEEPMVTIPTRRREVISYALYGDIDEIVLREKAEELRDLLLLEREITQVQLEGIRAHEIHVEVPMENLRRYNLSLAQVAQRIRSGAVELPGGSIKAKGGEILVRMKERRDLAKEYALLPVITLADGSRVLLSEIASIKEGFSDSNSYATFNGKPAIRVEVFRVGSQKPTKVAAAVIKQIALFKAGLPPGIRIAMVRNLSDIFRQRAELLIRNGLLGLCLVFLCLALFLEIRLAFWVSMGIPISVLGSFLILPLTGFSINIISMFAFIVTLGIVVDDAIVTGENIYHHRQLGMGYFKAAVQGAKEIAMPVTFSVITNIVAFLPILFVPGIMGKIYRTLPMVVIAVFAISLVESLFVLPAHLAHQKRKPPEGPVGWIVLHQQRFSKGFTKLVGTLYGPLLALIIRHRYTTIALGIALLSITAGYVKSGRMGMILFPRVESNYAYVSATLPYGAAAAGTASVKQVLVDAARKVVAENGGAQLSTGIYARVNENVITARLLLTPPDVRPVSTETVSRAWRKTVGEIPGIESMVFQSDRGGPGSGSSLTVELSHRNIDLLTAASEALAEELSFFPNVKDIDDGSARGKAQFDFRMLPEGQRLGLTARDVAVKVRHGFYGAEALRIQRERNEVKVMVRLPQAQRLFEASLDELVLRTPGAGETLLREVVSMERGRAYTTIKRRALRRIASVTADVIPLAETNRVITTLEAEVLPLLIARYPGLTYSFQGKQAHIRDSVKSLIRGLLMGILVIYALLAIPFRSYLQPLIIMASIPFGIIGAVIGHLLLGFPLSLMSLFGLVALSGVVVNDSLVLIHTANRRREGGMGVFLSIHQAGIHRFRPILLTTLTTFGGLAPMIFETSRQARFMIPMAVSLGFGILFATFITLALVPCLYMVLEDIRGLLGSEEETVRPDAVASPSLREQI